MGVCHSRQLYLQTTALLQCLPTFPTSPPFCHLARRRASTATSLTLPSVPTHHVQEANALFEIEKARCTPRHERQAQFASQWQQIFRTNGAMIPMERPVTDNWKPSRTTSSLVAERPRSHQMNTVIVLNHGARSPSPARSSAPSPLSSRKTRSAVISLATSATTAPRFRRDVHQHRVVCPTPSATPERS